MRSLVHEVIPLFPAGVTGNFATTLLVTSQGFHD